MAEISEIKFRITCGTKIPEREFKYESGSKEDLYFSSDVSGEGYTEEQEKSILLKKPIKKHNVCIISAIICVTLLFFIIMGFFVWIVSCAQIRMYNNSTNYTTNLCI